MILTFTPNPSVDVTYKLAQPLVEGSHNNACAVFRHAAGKGVNVTHAIHKGGNASLALIPARHDDPLIELLNHARIPFERVAVPDFVRTNTKITTGDGSVTQINGPGITLTPLLLQKFEASLCQMAHDASWVVLAGSLPPGAPEDWYVVLMQALRRSVPDINIALDSSGIALHSVKENLKTVVPDLLTPNLAELAEVTDSSFAELESAVAVQDFSGVIEAAQVFVNRGVPTVMVTMGAQGALLVTEDKVLHACAPAVTVNSAVGAGDAALAAFVTCIRYGETLADSLIEAVAFGAATTTLDGTDFPAAHNISRDGIVVEEIS